MKALFSVLLFLISISAFAQKYQDPLLYGENKNRVDVYYLLGVPSDTLQLPATKINSVHFAIKNGQAYYWNIIDYRWDSLGTGGVGGADGNTYPIQANFQNDVLEIEMNDGSFVTSAIPLSEKLNSIDTADKWTTGFIKNGNDVYYFKGGVPIFAFTDEVGSGSGGSAPVTEKTISITAFRDRSVLTVKEAETWIDNNLSGGDTIGFYRAIPDTFRAIERKEVMPGLENYEAFPILTRSPVTGTMTIDYQLSRSHAGNSAAAYIRSTDGGRTWSGRLYKAERKTGTDYKAAAVLVRPSNGWWYTWYDNGIGNTLGLNPRIANFKISKNDALSFDSVMTMDLTAQFAYRTTMSSHTGYITKAGTQLVPVYGLDAVGDKFEAGYVRSTDWFTTWQFIFYPQDSSIHKFNESTFLEKGDSLFVFIRSENLSGPYLYRSYSMDDGLTWSTPVGVSYNGRSTRPNVVLLPDGRLFLTQRANVGTQRAIIYVSTNNGLSFVPSGYLYPEDKPFMYASQIVHGDHIISAYSFETGTAPAFASATAGIHLATFPADNSAIFYRDSVKTSLVKPGGSSTILANRFRGFVPTEYTITSEVEKPVYVRSDSTATPKTKDIALIAGGDILGPTLRSVINDISHSGIQSNPFQNTPGSQGGTAWSDTIASIDSVAITGKFASAAVGIDGNIYLAPTLSGGTNLAMLNPQTKKIYYYTFGNASDHRGIAAIGENIYALATGLSHIKKFNVYTKTFTTLTLPSNGWNGLTYAEGYLWSSKSASNQILKYDIKSETATVLTTPSSGSWAAGPFDGRYVWMIGNNTSYWLKVNPRSNEIFEVAKDLPLSAINGSRQTGVFDGVNIYANDYTGNIMFRMNPHTNFSRSDTLPTGTYSNLRWDGASLWVINRTAANLLKFNTKTNTYKAIQTPGFGVTNKWTSSIFHNNKLYLIPEDVGKVAIITTNEFGGDQFKRIYDSTKLEFPVDTISVGRMITNRVVIGDSLIISTAYANAGGTGDRTGTVTATTDLSMVGAASTLVNGVTCCITNVYFNIQTVAGKYIAFDFGESKFITEAKFHQSAAVSHGTWQWQGSHDNSSWSNIGSTFTLGGGVGIQTQTTLSANITAYRYYRILGVSGSTTNAPYIYEYEFKITNTSENYAYIQVKQGLNNTGIIQINGAGGELHVPDRPAGDNSDNAANTGYVDDAVSKPYAQYSLTGTYTYAAANTKYSIAYNTEQEESGITHDPSVNAANITFTENGAYLVTASFNAFGSVGDLLSFSFELDGTSITNSGLAVNIPVANYHTPVTLTFIVNAGANDVLNVVTTSSANTATLQSISAANGIAYIPASKITIQKL